MKTYQNKVIYFAKTNYRDDSRLFGMYRRDKVFHTLVTGKTGTGKSNLLETKIMQEIDDAQSSVIVFDPAGDLTQRILEKFPTHRLKDLIVIDPSDNGPSFGYNPLKQVRPEHRHLVVSGVIEIFQRLYGSAWGLRLEHILRFCLYTLLDQKKGSLADIPRLLLEPRFRERCVKNITTKEVRSFWLIEFPKYRSEALLPLLTKLSFFVTNPAVMRTVIEPWRDISLRHAIDNKKVILIRLAKGVLGADVSSLIGSLLVTSLSLASFSRADRLEWERPYCSLYIDEFQNYTSAALASMFSELRKFNVGLTIATQYLSSIKQDIRDAVLGNVGSLISFRVSYDEAKVLAKYMHPRFSAEDIAGLPNYYIVLVLMINGIPSMPFSGVSLTYSQVLAEKNTT